MSGRLSSDVSYLNLPNLLKFVTPRMELLLTTFEASKQFFGTGYFFHKNMTIAWENEFYQGK